MLIGVKPYCLFMGYDKMFLFVCVFNLILYVPVNNFSVVS